MIKTSLFVMFAKVVPVILIAIGASLIVWYVIKRLQGRKKEEL